MNDDPHLPDGLKQALRSRLASDAGVPPEIDRMILAGARQHLLRRRPFRIGIAVAAAAALLISGTVLWMNHPGREPTRLALSGDANQDRKVNILDALTLARQGGVPEERIRQIAIASVSLEGTP